MQARMLKLHHNTVKQLLNLKKEAEQEGEYRVATRIHAVLLNHDGYSSGGIATLLKAPRPKVSEWLKKYNKFGFDILDAYQKKDIEYKSHRLIASTPAVHRSLFWAAPSCKN